MLRAACSPSSSMRSLPRNFAHPSPASSWMPPTAFSRFPVSPHMKTQNASRTAYKAKFWRMRFFQDAWPNERTPFPDDIPETDALFQAGNPAGCPGRCCIWNVLEHTSRNIAPERPRFPEPELPQGAPRVPCFRKGICLEAPWIPQNGSGAEDL